MAVGPSTTGYGSDRHAINHQPARRTMNIDKNQIVELLRSNGDHAKADEADRNLPPTVDTDRDNGLLDSLGLDIAGLLTKFGGGGLGKLLG
jgi:hypothetical protein